MAKEVLDFTGIDYQNRGNVLNAPFYAFNAYYDAGWKYKSSDFAMLIEFVKSTGVYTVYTAPSGTINGSITWTARQTMNSDGVVSFVNAVRGGQTTLTSSSNSIAIDFKTSNDFLHTFTEDTTLANPSNVVIGQSGYIFLTQHASSPKTLAFGSNYEFENLTPFAVSATNSAKDVISYTVKSATEIILTILKNVG